ncbi:MAG: sulfotransferase domain-containing protein [Coleofasciculus sp. D1-CHI-01]|uniref:sulfotransferase domain-containing protein n=1 Tax=Coleofasciculus sp. D1-CHI-01 TaxID=3068482 RepID=UPI0032F3AAC3
MQNPKPLIHIGYPKTGSTWLQNVIFKDETSGFLSVGGAIAQFVIPNTFRFSAESARKAFEPSLQEAVRRDLVPVLSHEHLAGSQLGGNYHGKEVAERIHSVFPEARILIFIREQKSMIFSSYAQRVKSGGTPTIQRFIGADIKNPGFAPICRLDHLEYDLLISYYQKLFDSNNILVLPFELFKKNPQDVCLKIINFAEAKGNCDNLNAARNVRFKGATLAIKRRLNRFVDNDFAGSGRSPSWRLVLKIAEVVDSLPLLEGIHERIEQNWKQFIAEYVGDYFRLSNQRTSQLIGMNLADFGYDC